MNKKKRQRKSVRVPGGYPEIAHPNEEAKYQRQLLFVHDWFSKMLERVEGEDEKAAQAARYELQALLVHLGGQLLRLGLANKDSATKEWAGTILASVFVSIGKYAGKVRIEKPYRKLTKTNAAFRNEKEKLGGLRTDVLFPGPITEIVQRELKLTEDYRKRLLVIKAVTSLPLHEPTRVKVHHPEAGELEVSTFRPVSGKVAAEAAAEKHGIPEDYWPAAELLEFSATSEPKWWNFLWPLIRKHNPDFLQTLRTGGILTRGIRYQSRWATYRPEFRSALQTLARLRTGGVL